MLSISINPDWPYITVIVFLVALAYARFVTWRVNHPRYRRYWRSQVWKFVAVGNTGIAATAGALFGIETFVVIMLLNALWGLPMIVAVEMVNERQQAAEDEQADATR